MSHMLQKELYLTICFIDIKIIMVLIKNMNIRKTFYLLFFLLLTAFVHNLYAQTKLNELAKRKVIESTLTLLKNKNNIIPLKELDTLKIACLAVGKKTETPFQKMLSKYTKTDNFYLPEEFSSDELKAIKSKLKNYNLIIAGMHISLFNGTENLLSWLAKEKQSIEVFFSEPNTFPEIKNFKPPNGLIMAYKNDSLVQELSAQLIFGGIKASGKLQITLGNYYKTGDGIITDQVIRMKYTIPEEAGINSKRLNHRIDSLVSDAINKKATPGCSILAVKDGKVIFRKTYGYHTFYKRIHVTEDDLYDLASVTKISGATAAILKLTDEGKIDINDKFSNYWSDWKKRLFHKSNKEDLRWKDILSHQAGLIPYLKYWEETVNEEGYLYNKLYSFQQTNDYQLEVAPGLFLKNKFKKRVYKDIRLTKLNPAGKYVYSGLSFLIIPQITKDLSGKSFTEFLDTNFYHSLGAYRITYNPLRKFPRNQTVPTEYDKIYRKQQIQGTVHDEAAAVMGGISGNAGLFANANDLAKLMQMYMQMGTYGGKQYISKETMKKFTSVQFPENNNRRGLGFDKPALNNSALDMEHSYPCKGPSPESFGHFGFTGTFVWADPTYNLVYIFLSNRVYPTRENNLLGKLNVRTNILQVLYEEINK